MTPVIQCSTSNVALFPGTTFSPRKKNRLTIYSYQRKSVKYTSTSQRFLLPDSTSVGLNRKYNRDYGAYDRLRVHILAATGTDIAVENPIVDENAEGTSEVSPTTSEAVEVPPSTTPTTQSSRFTPRKGEMPPVKNEELVVGATFTGKVKSIQPFGAFVDFGGFKDGLVHVSQVSSSFVRDIGSFVSIGQEVTVRLLEANLDTGRISLTMREPGDDVNKSQQRKDAPSGSKSDTPRSSDKPRPARNNSTKPNQKSSKFVNGQILQGTVKNIIGRGAFISLPEGEEGFLPTDEEADDGLANMMGGSSLQVGEEVSVRVLKISRGQVTLTMKAENAGTPNLKVVQSEVHVATNPFAMAFRRNKDIAAFIDETEKLKKVAEIPIKPESVQKTKKKVDQTELVNTEENLEKGVSGSLEDNDLAQGTIQEELSSEILAPGEALASVNSLTEEISVTDEVKEVKNESEQSSDETLTPENIITDDVVESIADDGPVKDEVKEVKNESEQSSDETLTPGIIVTDEVVESIADDGLVKDEVKTDTPSTIEKEVSSSDNDEKRESVLKENASLNTSSGEAESLFTPTSSTKATISPALVKSLRDETGAGMMDCKNALSETGGDLIKAQEFLRKKGLASADKKASRVTAEGRVGSYIHDSRIGVLVEVNCETDFVSRGEIFKELVDDLAMQVAACAQVKYLATDDVAEEIVNKERELEMQKEDLLSKPEQIRSKIVDGRIRKRLEELALLEQPYIKNDKVVVKDLVKQTIATIGENIKVKRFVRFNLGEGLEKKSQDFAAEVAAQTAAKPSPVVPKKDESAQVEAKEVVEKPKVTISAALVKQLRDETGAGMMDCKKALAETEGDLEKAQEYLRKKGLLSADKKSSRIAVEGRIGSYIHDSRIGVLIEVNCETDFVGRSEKFKELVDDLAMQVVACPQVQFVSIDEIDESYVSKEKALEMQREDLQSKPENIREKIVEGRISKRLGELALLEQPFIRNDSILVKDIVKQTVASLGENIKVRRFVRFTLGEAVEDAKATLEAERKE